MYRVTEDERMPTDELFVVDTYIEDNYRFGRDLIWTRGAMFRVGEVHTSCQYFHRENARIQRSVKHASKPISESV